MPELDDFTRAYIEAALWSSTASPSGACPDCECAGLLDHWNDALEYVCAKCGTREPNYEPPMDDNYSPDDLAPETLARIVEDCRTFQEKYGELLTDDSIVRQGSPDYTADERGGHDFWLTRAGTGCGFWDGDWAEPAATVLTNAAHAYGSFDLYVGDDGRIYA